jgi:hypothetical protein
MTETITIPRRFNGPPNFGHGGYVSGRAANFIDGAVNTKLRAPSPLETPLDVIHTEDGGVVLRHGASDIIIAQPATLTLDVPPMPSREAVAHGAEVGRKRELDHFRTCFVCGPSCATGMRIHVGVVPQSDPPARERISAAPWTPSAEYAAPDGLIAPEFLWAVLDCPSYWSLPRCGEIFAVLGSFTAAVDRRPKPGEQLVVAGWPLGSEGRKHRAGCAIYDAAGGVLARAESLWIEVTDPERFK